MITQLQQQPIEFNYPYPSKEFLEILKSQATICEIENTDHIVAGNDYYHQNISGTLPKIFTRLYILEQLMLMKDILSPHYGIYIFDAFRTIETQTALFNQFHDSIRHNHPELTGEALELEVCKYVSHPHELSRFKVPPHNSGDAVDLALYDLTTHQVLDFGCSFDYLGEISATDYFEKAYQAHSEYSETRWQTVRSNRRLLFNLMKMFGFTNYAREWWHYDLGDEMWGQLHQQPPVFNSMEAETKQRVL